MTLAPPAHADGDPCDEWPWAWPANGWPMLADRRQPASFEDLDPRSTDPAMARFFPYVRTDWTHWPHDLEWTLESGPDDAPSSIEILVPYRYSPGTGPSWSHPGDPAEVEVGTPTFLQDGAWGEVSLLRPELNRVELHIAENPPEPDYGDGW